MIKNNVSYDTAKHLLIEGDVLLFRGKGPISFVIKRAGEGKYSHAGVASVHGDNGGQYWECVEFREWYGGRTVNLERYVELNSGRIDVYRPVPMKCKVVLNEDLTTSVSKTTLDGKKVTNVMRRMTGLPYGWKRIMWIAQRKIPFLRLFYDVDSVIDDSTQEVVYPVCSTAISYAFSKAGYDLLHNRSDNSMEPSDISRSPLLFYLFTLN